jgi:hypothetical protein
VGKLRAVRDTFRGSVARMDETRAVLERLRRIEALDRATVDPARLLDELRALVREAEALAAADAAGDGRDEAGAIVRA